MRPQLGATRPLVTAGRRPKPRELVVAGWALSGVALLLTQAMVRLTPLALEPIERGVLSPLQIAIYAAWVVFSAYTEGYRAFHLAWSPRVVARAWLIAERPRPLHVALAPFVAMGLLHATRRRLIISWSLALAIVAAILLLRHVPQPYRGIVDGGVVVGLALGLLSLIVHFARSLRGNPPEVPSDMPLEPVS
jgi:hypothetical protein